MTRGVLITAVPQGASAPLSAAALGTGCHLSDTSQRPGELAPRAGVASSTQDVRQGHGSPRPFLEVAVAHGPPQRDLRASWDTRPPQPQRGHTLFSHPRPGDLGQDDLCVQGCVCLLGGSSSPHTDQEEFTGGGMKTLEVAKLEVSRSWRQAGTSACPQWDARSSPCPGPWDGPAGTPPHESRD